MDFFPSVFSQKELYWLDNLMPASNKKGKKSKKKNAKTEKDNILGSNAVSNLIYLNVIQLLICFSRKKKHWKMEQLSVEWKMKVFKT